MYITQSIKIGPIKPGEAQLRGLRHIGNGEVHTLLPGDIVVAELDSRRAIIVATSAAPSGDGAIASGDAVLVTQADDSSAIREIVMEFEEMGISPGEITMTIQMHEQKDGGPFMDEAILSGIIQVWSSEQIKQMLGKSEMLTICREEW